MTNYNWLYTLNYLKFDDDGLSAAMKFLTSLTKTESTKTELVITNALNAAHKVMWHDENNGLVFIRY